MYSRIQDMREWKRAEIGSQETEVASVMSTQFMEDSHYRRMRQMDKDGKNVVAEFVYRHAVWQTFFWINPFFRGFWISIPNGERGVVS